MSLPRSRANSESEHPSGGDSIDSIGPISIQDCTPKKEDAREIDRTPHEGDVPLSRPVSPTGRTYEKKTNGGIPILGRNYVPRQVIDFDHSKFDCDGCNGNCNRRRQCCASTEDCCLIDRRGLSLFFQCATQNREVKLGIKCEKAVEQVYGFDTVSYHKKPYRTMYTFSKGGSCSWFSTVGSTGVMWPRLFIYMPEFQEKPERPTKRSRSDSDSGEETEENPSCKTRV